MASQTAPAYCPVEWDCDNETHSVHTCGKRGMRAHGGLCKYHRAKAAEALAALNEGS